MDLDKETVKCPYMQPEVPDPAAVPGGLWPLQEPGGEVKELISHSYLVVCPIFIETMPMLHFYPGGKFLQLSGVGCNLHCPACISTTIAREMGFSTSLLQKLSPRQVVERGPAGGLPGDSLAVKRPSGLLGHLQGSGPGPKKRVFWWAVPPMDISALRP